MAPKIISWTGDTPSVLHFQGYARIKYSELMMSYVTHTGIKLPDNVSIVTFCNGESNYHKAVLLKQLDAAGIQYCKRFGFWTVEQYMETGAVTGSH